MKKIFLSLVLSLFLVPLAANSAAIEITSVSASPSGGVSNGSGTNTASGTHGAITGQFSDVWSLTFPTPNAVVSLTAGGFSAFSVEYNRDNSNIFTTAGIINNGGGNWSILPPVLLGINSPLFVRLTGAGINGQYALNIQNAGPSTVPVPAAVWLFGSALMGLVGVSRRKKA
ncbi:MAG: VPLPA-CTERM sorting domain-containing protein [Methyloprofundus sp.]|nr:VPLPA-CTERM sorting domain-containing protein [Methyloprofundus sp.]